MSSTVYQHLINTFARKGTAPNPGLLLQFLLVDFFQISSSSKKIRSFLKTMDKAQESAKERCLSQLSQLSTVQDIHTPWSREDGCLRRFIRFAALLDKTWPKNRASSRKVLRLSEQAFGLVEKALRNFREWTTKSKEASKERTKKSLERLLSCLNSLSSILQEIVSLFASDETTVYFLIRHREALAKSFSPAFLKKILVFHFQKTQSVEAFLTTEFSKKGFEQLLPEIQQELRACGDLLP